MPHMSNNCSNITAALVPEAPRAAASSSSPLNYDAVVILAAMVCALACVLGLNSMLQCVALCARRAVADTAGGWAARRRAADAGLKREDVAALPVSTYAAAPAPAPASGAAGCAICLSEFADGERIRELPVCGHRFHVACIDKWLVSHCSCPTCRRRLSAESSVVGGQRHLQVLTAV